VKYLPIKFSADDSGAIDILNQFKIYESAAKDSLLIKKVLPEILVKSNRLLTLKKEITEISEKKPERNIKINNLLSKYKDINHENLTKQCTEWSKLQTAIQDYTSRGGVVQQAAKNIKGQYRELIEAVRLFEKYVYRSNLELENSDDDSNDDNNNSNEDSIEDEICL